MFPDNLPVEMIDMICVHLKGRDLLNLRLVSHSWNDYLLNSKWFMRMIANRKLSIHAKKPIDDRNLQAFYIETLSEERKPLFNKHLNIIKAEKQAFKEFCEYNRVKCDALFNESTVKIIIKDLNKLHITEGSSIYVANDYDDKLLLVVQKITIDENEATIDAISLNPLNVSLETYKLLGVAPSSNHYNRQKYGLKIMFSENVDHDIQRICLFERPESNKYRNYVYPNQAIAISRVNKFTAIVGQPGTGKTHALVQIAKDHAKFHDRSSKILIVTSQNTSADSILWKLKGEFPEEYDVKRLNSHHHKMFVSQSKIREFCLDSYIESLLSNHEFYSSFESFQFEVLSLMIDQLNQNLIERKKQELKLATFKKSCLRKLIVEKNVQVIITTFGSLHNLPSEIKYDLVLVDEAGYVTEQDLFLAAILVAQERGRLILVGDPKQLEPFTYRKEKEESLLAKLERINHTNLLRINLQNRTVPQISELINDLFYKETSILYAQSLQQRRIGFPSDRHIMIVTHNFEESQMGREQMSEMSFFNKGEASIIVDLIRKLPVLINEEVSTNLVILTYYLSQKYLFNSIIPNIETSSIDAYQGKEKKIVVISCVRSNKNNIIGFLNSQSRLCTAISRAKDIIIIVCSKMFNSDDMPTFWKELMDYTNKENVIHINHIGNNKVFYWDKD